MANYNEWLTSDLEQAICEDASVNDVLYQCEGFLSKNEYRNLLIIIADGVLTNKD